MWHKKRRDLEHYPEVFLSQRSMAHKQKESGKRKRVDQSICEKLELIKKLELVVSVVMICNEYGVNKQADSDIRRSKDKLTSYAMKFDVAPCKDRKGTVHKRKHL